MGSLWTLQQHVLSLFSSVPEENVVGKCDLEEEELVSFALASSRIGLGSWLAPWPCPCPWAAGWLRGWRWRKQRRRSRRRSCLLIVCSAVSCICRQSTKKGETFFKKNHETYRRCCQMCGTHINIISAGPSIGF